MLTNGALLTAWETGKLPATTAELLRVSGLKDAEVAIPEGAPAWVAGRAAAVSEEHGSIHFATPLVELALDKVTPSEAREYKEFREGYLRLWRRFFDPIGMRLAMREGEVKLETYILPLIQSDFYNQMRMLTGNGTVTLDPGSFAPTTLFQYKMHLNPALPQLGNPVDVPNVFQRALQGLGDWALLRLDDGPDFAKLFQPAAQSGNDLRALAGLPLAAGVHLRNEKLTAKDFMQAYHQFIRPFLLGDRWKPDGGGTENYKDVQIEWSRAVENRDIPEPQRTRIGLYIAVFDGTAYATLSESLMKRLIDEAQARKEKVGKPQERWPALVNTSIHVSPAAVIASRPVLTRLAELPTNQEARSALGTWTALYRAGIVTPDAKPDAAAEAAFRFLGYVPTAPDRTAYSYDPVTDEVSNARHGSLRQPELAADLAETSPLARVLANLRAVRVDLRFREDGIHTTLTLTRKGAPQPAQASVIEAMTDALRSPDPSERFLAAQELGKRGAGAKSAVAALQVAMYDLDPQIRSAAENALRKVDPEALAMDRLSPATSAAILDTLRESMISRDPAQRGWAFARLASFGPAARGAVPALQVAMYDLDPQIRSAAENALRKVDPEALALDKMRPETTAGIMNNLSLALRYRNPPLREWALEVLPQFGAAAKPAIPVLQATMYDVNPKVRAAAAEVLRKIDPEALALDKMSPEAIAGIMDNLSLALRSGDRSSVNWALETLPRFGAAARPVCNGAALQVIRNGEDAEQRLAITVVATVGKPDKQTLATVLPFLDKELRVGWKADRRWAAEQLGKLGADAAPAVPELLNALRDPIGEVQQAAATALRKIDPEAARKAGVP
jgi:HEAT repeat protein